MRRVISGPLTPTQALREHKRALICRRSWQCLLTCLVCTALFTLALFSAVFGLALVQGDSMCPALQQGDFVLFFRLGKLKQSDVVILQMDGGHINKYVKRVIGLPGDSVDIDDQGRVLINGTPLDETYIYSITRRKTITDYPLVLGKGEYFVLGDNRGDSHDSRDFGQIANRMIDGTVVAVVRTGRKK